MNLRLAIDKLVTHALTDVGGQSLAGIVIPSSKPQFGDYQANGAMAAAKQLRQNPRAIASQVASRLEGDELFEKVEVAGPGFINLFLSDEALARALQTNPVLTPSKVQSCVVIDYSSPNLAKELHVGHLRSTVIGDAMARTFELLGHRVIRQNHVGDWGTGIGKLLTRLDETEGGDTSALSDLEQLYIEASKRFDEDNEFAGRTRANVVALQGGDEEALTLWRRFMEVSHAHMQDIYSTLDISLGPEDVDGESAYNEDLPIVIGELKKANLLTESDGALCVFDDRFKGKDGEVLPMLVQKSDGGYLYHTTDLATLRRREEKWQPDRVLYFTDARQILHFQMLFAVAKSAQFVPEGTLLEHHAFGKILGKDGKPFSTRDGSNIPLRSLLDEGERRAAEVIASKGSELNDMAQKEVATRLSQASIKYADLSKNLQHDYKFDWDTMLALDGNTAPYLLYAYARINSIFARGEIQPSECDGTITLVEASEHDLAVQLLKLQEVLETVLEDAKPHYLCAYLYDLTVRFMRFYEACPILNAPDASIKSSRLAICARTAETLKVGFSGLGITPLTRM